MATKYVYFFGAGKADGKGTMKDLLGGKGAGLAEMTLAGIPVPAGLYRHHRNLPLLLRQQTEASSKSSPRSSAKAALK